MSGYADFLATKARRVGTLGHEVEPGDVHPFLHDWQARIVTWAVRKGRAALWVDTGLGKTVMQLEWARLSGDRTLIVAPLAVCAQTVREAARIGIEAHYAQNDAQAAGLGVWVTNYERVAAFDPKDLDAVVLDEASILKQSDGKTRRLLITHFEPVPYRLTCTATPAPNDVEELTNQAEFLGVMPRAEMLAAYFVHDEKSWRVKGHARRPMFDWMATWALALRSPADLGYDATDYLLPKLDVRQHRLAVDIPPEDDELFAASIGGVGGRARVRKSSMVPRCNRTIELVNESHGFSAVGGKLSAWDTTPSTSGSTTSPTAKNESPKPAKTKQPTENTAASTTANGMNATESGYANTGARQPISEMLDGESDTPPIPHIESNRESKPKRGAPPKQDVTHGYVSSSESAPSSTTTSSLTKTAVARSAEQQSETGPAEGSTSITATTLAESGESSARNATSVSESFGTTPSYSGERSSTSPKLEPWVIWCGLNDEQKYLERAFGDRCISIYGSQSPEEKVALLYRWLDGDVPILLTKTSMTGSGINMQHCARMAFVGLSDSWEAYYQAIRRRAGPHRHFGIGAGDRIERRP
jgi:hypothetical protein